MAFHIIGSFRTGLAKPSLCICRYYGVPVNGDIRQRLMSEIKAALKNKDNATSTTLRAVLSDIHAADKASSEAVGSSTIVSIIRKAAFRRSEAASQFLKASRKDLADREQHELSILSTFLPPLLSEAEIDRILHEIILEQSVAISDPPRKALGKVIRVFYSKVDGSTVDPTVVKKIAEALLSSLSKPS